MLSIPVEPALEEKIAYLTKRLRTTPVAFVNEAIRAYVEDKEDYVEARYAAADVKKTQAGGQKAPIC